MDHSQYKRMSFVIVGDNDATIYIARRVLHYGHNLTCIFTNNEVVLVWAARNNIAVYSEDLIIGHPDLNVLNEINVGNVDCLLFLSQKTPPIQFFKHFNASYILQFVDGEPGKSSGIYAPSWDILRHHPTHQVNLFLLHHETGKIMAKWSHDIPLPSNPTIQPIKELTLRQLGKLIPLFLQDLQSEGFPISTESLPELSALFQPLNNNVSGLVSWSDSIETIDRFNRALNYHESDEVPFLLKVLLYDTVLILKEYKLVKTKHHLKPGTIRCVNDKILVIAFKDGYMEISDPFTTQLNYNTYQHDGIDERLRVGNILPDPSLEFRQEVANFLFERSTDEEFWCQELTQIKFLFLTRKKSYQTKLALNFRIAKDVHTRLEQLSHQACYRHVIIACLAAYFYRIVNGDNLTFFLKNNLQNASLQSFACSFIPLNLELSNDLSFHDLLDTIVQKMQLIEEKKCLSQDILFKYNRKYSSSQSLGQSKTPVYILFNDEYHPEEELNPNTLVIHVDTNAQKIHFYYDNATEGTTPIIFGNISHHFKAIMQQISLSPGSKLHEYEFLSDVEKRLLTEKWNPPIKHDKGLKNIIELIEEIVIEFPNEIALVREGEALTYSEFNNEVNRIAHYLRETVQVKPNQFVALLLDRSINMIVAILAVIKAGAAYLPISPQSATTRIQNIIQDAKPVCLISSNFNLTKHPGLNVNIQILSINKLQEQNDILPADNLTIINSPDDLICALYTSGSTGVPKAVKITHQNLSSCMYATIDAFGKDSSDIWLLHHEYFFDISILEIFFSLVTGATLAIPDLTVIQFPKSLFDFIRSFRVTALCQVPTAFIQLTNYIERSHKPSHLYLRKIILGGERFPVEAVKKWRDFYPRSPVCIYDIYGPTEITVYCTAVKATKNLLNRVVDCTPIGEVLSNANIFVFDEYLNMQPIGAPGMIYVTGSCVSAGYLNQPELENQKFIIHPVDGKRYYNTGDLAYWSDDGLLYSIGRADNQVKVRGYRIELDEIASKLMQHPYIKQAYVTVQDNEFSHKTLLSYVSLDETKCEMELSETKPHIKQWQSLMDDVYCQADLSKTDGANIAWHSSYTGHPFISEEMREWVTTTVRKISSYSPKRVLEIGCGTGLLLQQLAPHVKHYQASDFSKTIIEVLQKFVYDQKYSKKVQLLINEAVTRSDNEAQSSDTVIINSVVQYLPDAKYLNDVLLRSVDACKDGGVIFIGDIRSLRDLELFHYSLQLYQIESTTTVSDLKSSVFYSIEREQELLISPEFFIYFSNNNPRVSHIEVTLRRGTYLNEMTQFRYDVVLHINNKAQMVPVTWNNYAENQVLIEDIILYLKREKPSIYGLRNIKNLRLMSLSADVEKIKIAPNDKSVSDVINDSSVATLMQGICPEKLATACEELGYEVKIVASDKYTLELFDIVCTKKKGVLLESFKCRTNQPTNEEYLNFSWLTNSPMMFMLQKRLAGVFRNYLQEHLPAYMIPANFIFIRKFPETQSGKINPKGLPKLRSVHHQESYFPPRSQIEYTWIRLWKKYLSIESIGIYDNFFSIGGDSIIAIQILSEAKEYNLDVSSSLFFKYPTIAELAMVSVRNSSISDHDEMGISAPFFEQLDQPYLNDVAIIKRKFGTRFEDTYPLTPVQEGILYQSISLPNHGVYLEQVSVTFKGSYNAECFQNAWNSLIARHEILRTLIIYENTDHLMQVVLKTIGFSYPEIDLRKVKSKDKDPMIKKLADEDRALDFDLQRGPLFRVKLIRLNDLECILYISFHHIICDGWSVIKLINDLFTFYSSELNHTESDLPQKIPFGYYCMWLLKQDKSLAEKYWKQQLHGITQSTRIEFDNLPENIHDYKLEQVEFEIGEALNEHIKLFAQNNRVSVNDVFQSAWVLTLARYCNIDQISYHTILSGRSANIPMIKSQVGVFIQTLLQTINVDQDQTVLALLQLINKIQSETRLHSNYPLTDVLKHLDSSVSKDLTDYLYVFENFPADYLHQSKFDGAMLQAMSGTYSTHYTISFLVFPGDTAKIVCAYNARRLSKKNMQDFVSNYVTLLTNLIDDSNQFLKKIQLLSESEQKKILYHRNKAKYQVKDTVIDLFERRVDVKDTAIAVLHSDHYVSYSTLNRKINQLSHYLLSKKIGENDRIAIYLNRTPLMLIAIFAVLKTGAAYVPIDPNYPLIRSKYILEDSKPVVLLTEKALRRVLDYDDENTICLDLDWHMVELYSCENPELTINPESLAYVLYTSGSTGRQKGVMMPHRGLNNFIQYVINNFSSDQLSGVLACTSLCFDLSVFEIFGGLCSGGRLHLVNDISEVSSFAYSDHISLINTVPTNVKTMLETHSINPSVNTIVMAGDIIPRELVRQIFNETKVEYIYNGYGPTECLYVSFGVIDKQIASCSNIGKPISNLDFYVFSSENTLAPMNVPGELYISGDCVALGYLNMPEVSDKRFVNNELDYSDHNKLYRTGDIVKQNEDGTYEFIGRIDDQVKIHGFRVELGEIESYVLSHPSVVEASVIVKKNDKGEKILTVYITCSDMRTAPNHNELKNYMMQYFPGYMVPISFVLIDKMPKLPNGKIDKAELSHMNSTFILMQRKYVPPSNEIQQDLCQVWADVLGSPLSNIGINDDFYELGGHSLLIIKIINSIHQKMKIKLSILEFLNNPTVASLSVLIDTKLRLKSLMSAESIVSNAYTSQRNLIAFRTQGTKSPLFFIHAISGTVYPYIELVKELDENRPIYGIQDFSLDSDQIEPLSMDEIVARYVHLMKQIQPRGPYYLAGFSSGGFIAAEIAHKLYEEGDTVAFLGLIDSWVQMPKELAHRPNFENMLLPYYDDFKKDTLRQIFPSMKTWSDLSWERFNMIRHYIPHHCPCEITLFKAETKLKMHREIEDSKNGWEEYASHGITVLPAPGNHMQLLKQPYVKKLAKLLSNCLSNADIHSQAQSLIEV